MESFRGWGRNLLPNLGRNLVKWGWREAGLGSLKGVGLFGGCGGVGNMRGKGVEMLRVLWVGMFEKRSVGSECCVFAILKSQKLRINIS